MAKRGRKSIKAIETAVVTLDQRPLPPSDLTIFQKKEWSAVVGRMPGDWFTRETHGLLTQYVRHVENASRLAEKIDSFNLDLLLTNETDMEVFEKLTKMMEREGRAMSSLATRLRITQQSRYNPASANVAAKKAGTVLKPWEFESDAGTT